MHSNGRTFCIHALLRSRLTAEIQGMVHYEDINIIYNKNKLRAQKRLFSIFDVRSTSDLFQR